MNSNTSLQSLRQPAAVALLLPILVTWPVVLNACHWCYAYYDLGIYSDALQRLSFDTPNPWLDARQIKIFNDHFDPILWVGKPLVLAGLPAHIAGILTESVFALASTVPIFYLCSASEISPRSAAMLTLLLLFNTAATDALTFPMHPTTWAMAPFFWLGVSLHFRRYWWSLVSVLVLCLCKEEFPFACMMVSIVLLKRNERKWAVVILIISASSIAYSLVLRPYLDASTSNYGGAVFSGLGEDVLAFILRRLTVPRMWTRVGSILLTLFPTFLWIRREQIEIDWWISLPLIPTAALRLIGMSWRGHYNACLLAGFLAVLLPVFIRRRPPMWTYVLTIAFIFLTNQNRLKLPIAAALQVTTRSTAHCPANVARLRSIEEGVAYLRRRQTSTVLAGQNLVLPLVGSAGVFALGGPQTKHGPTYNFVFVEKPPNGVAWPYDTGAISSAIRVWRASDGVEVIQDDDYIFLARGNFVDPTPLGQFGPI